MKYGFLILALIFFNFKHWTAQLVQRSQADRMGLLHVGDQILAVNGIPTTNLHYDEVVRLIRDSGFHITLKILPCPSSMFFIYHLLFVSFSLMCQSEKI